MSVRSAKLLATNLFGRRRRAAPMKYHRSVRPDGRSARAPGRRPSVAVAAGKDCNRRGTGSLTAGFPRLGLARTASTAENHCWCSSCSA